MMKAMILFFVFASFLVLSSMNALAECKPSYTSPKSDLEAHLKSPIGDSDLEKLMLLCFNSNQSFPQIAAQIISEFKASTPEHQFQIWKALSDPNLHEGSNDKMIIGELGIKLGVSNQDTRLIADRLSLPPTLTEKQAEALTSVIINGGPKKGLAENVTPPKTYPTSGSITLGSQTNPRSDDETDYIGGFTTRGSAQKNGDRTY